MCGICGYVSRRQITIEQLTVMNDSIAYRGPDDSGVELYPAHDGYMVGMAQRRLSILDLSALGHQPMHSADGRLTIVYNGEVYNYQELRKELHDYPFKSNCDTEVLLAAYLKWGLSFVDRCNGMFAIAIYDRKRDELILARDRMGVKPLYYWIDGAAAGTGAGAGMQDGISAGGAASAASVSGAGAAGTAGSNGTTGAGIIFASELKPLMLCPGFERRIRRDVLGTYLYQQYLCGPETIYEDVYRLMPGTILRFRHGRMETWQYWDVATTYHKMQENPVTDYEEARDTLHGLLQDAVARRMIADVPLGCFLSGGYDSSLVSALAQAHLGSTPLKTFSIGFDDPEYDESPYAEAVARHLGTDHTTLRISENDMYGLVESIPQYYDEPLADSSQIPTMLVSQLARTRVTVALSGDAGDEFYAGYNIYDRVRQAQQLDLLGAAAYRVGQIPLGGSRLYDHYPIKLRVIAGNRNPRTKAQFGAGSYVDIARAMVNHEGLASELPINYETELRYGVDNWQIRRMLLDMDTYLPGDIMAKVDRASMKYSLETRCPLLDVNVMEYSYRIDHRFKYHKGDKKYILKQLAYDYIPKELLVRPKKGFSVPLGKWLQGPLRERLLTYADPTFLRQQGMFDADYTTALINRFLETGDAGHGTGQNYSGLVWSFYVFQMWYERYIAK